MKKFTLTVFVIMLALTVAVCSVAVYNNTYSKVDDSAEAVKPPLVFDEDGQFKILHLTDFHEWLAYEEDDGSITLKQTLKPLFLSAFNDFLDREKPDLLVLGGDNIFPLSFIYDLFGNISVRTYKAIADILEERGQYWTLTFGNHDAECVKTKSDFLNALKDYKYFLGGRKDSAYVKTFELSAKIRGESNYVGNFSIPIYSDNGKNILYNVFVLDSGSYESPPPKGTSYRYIQNEQVEWYASEALRLKNIAGRTVPSVMFTHIPLVEVREAWEQGAPSTGVFTGTSASDYRSALYAKMAEMRDVAGIFFGHQHSSSYTCVYEKDGYSLVMGLTPYCQAQSYEDTTSSMYGRVIELRADGSLQTKIICNKSYYDSDATTITSD